MEQLTHGAERRIPWNAGKLVGQKAPLKLKDIWAIRVLVKLRVRDICHSGMVAKRAIVIQQKTQRPVQFEITEQTRESVIEWIREFGLRTDDFLFPSRIHCSPHLSTRQYARIVHRWVREIGLDSSGSYKTRKHRAVRNNAGYQRPKLIPRKLR